MTTSATQRPQPCQFELLFLKGVKSVCDRADALGGGDSREREPVSVTIAILSLLEHESSVPVILSVPS